MLSSVAFFGPTPHAQITHRILILDFQIVIVSPPVFLLGLFARLFPFLARLFAVLGLFLGRRGFFLVVLMMMMVVMTPPSGRRTRSQCPHLLLRSVSVASVVAAALVSTFGILVSRNDWRNSGGAAFLFFAAFAAVIVVILVVAVDATTTTTTATTMLLVFLYSGGSAAVFAAA